MESRMRKLLRNWRIITLITMVSISLALVTNIIPINKERANEPIGIGFGNGLDYGLDFAGGIQIQLRLEDPINGTITPDMVEVEKGILERRLNAMGLRDIPVRPWGDRYILIQVASASPEEVESIENILKQQARFEARIDGELAISGSEISVDLSPGGSGAGGTGPSQWYVAIRLSSAGGERFCETGGGKRGKPIDMFLDRPENTIIVMENATYSHLEELKDEHKDDMGRISSSCSYIEVIENRSRLQILVVENDTYDPNRLSSFTGCNKAIILADEDRISDRVRNELEEMNFSTERRPIGGDESYEEWIRDVIGLESDPNLMCDPCTQCKYGARISGVASTLKEAKAEMEETKILLSSGNLPAKAVVESKSEFPSSLGEKFLEYSFIIGVIAIITVALVIFIRYRTVFIVIPTMTTGLSEILIILGIASLVNWELDLPAVAGIIAAVGTGVDDQIVITDETIKRGKEKKKVVSLTERIRRAFFIIFTAAATTIAVMIPVFSIQALKGFAFMTIVGVLIGVFVTRPAYAKIIEVMLED
jgi:preprotein translocase subunit SecD